LPDRRDTLRRRDAPAGLSAYPPAAAKKSISRSFDAFRLVVMHPVRRVGEVLHAVEVGYVVPVRFGELLHKEAAGV
jgi:hypothetical protein